MDNQLISPNFHAALLHLPFGLFGVGMLVEIFSFLYPRGDARKAARWMIALGVLLMIPVALSGVYALTDVVRRSMPPGAAVDQPWQQLIAKTHLHEGRTSGTDEVGEQWHEILSHAWKMATATSVAVLAVVVGIACSKRWWRRLYVPIGLVLLASLAWMCWGAWSGGEMVYRFGTGVEANMRRAGSQPPPMPSAAMEQTEVRSRESVAYYAPPLQTHVVAAGLAAAFALGALGLALRNTARPEPRDIEDEIFASAAAADVAMVRSFKPAAVVAPEQLRPAARTWIAGSFFALGAAALGFWFLTSATDALSFAKSQQRPLPAVLWDTVKTPVDAEQKSAATSATTAAATPAADHPANPLGLNRRLAHVIAGTAVVVLPLLLAIFAKWKPHRRLPIVLLSMVLIAALGVQVWLGVLMLFDGPAGHIVMLR